MIYLIITIVNDDVNFSALVELYTEKKDFLYKIAHKILLNEVNAEDAVQEAFYKLSKNIKRINELKCPERVAYAVVVVKNTSIDMKKNKKGDFL